MTMKDEDAIKILRIVKEKMEQGITGKIIFNFNEGKLGQVNFEYTVKIK